MRLCSIDGCEDIHLAKGFCNKHYRRMHYNGHYENYGSKLVGAPLMNRVMFYVEKTDTCWAWTGWKDKHGYGSIKVSGKHVKAHRASWMVHNGDRRVACLTSLRQPKLR